jgi:hypothetical protein
MPLITDSTEKVFDTASVHKGDLIRAKYQTWSEARNGLITAVSESKLAVLFLPGLGNVTNYFTIQASEVGSGKWAVLWSSDLVTINTEGTMV